jgi:hypothetical protein
MKICTATLTGIPGSPYSQSGFLNHIPKLERESAEDYDLRTWREHCNTNDSGQICIPAMGLKMAIDTTAFKLGEKVPGRRGATYRSFFESGFIVDGDVPIANGKALKPDDAEMVAIMSDSKGRRGASGGSRVLRRFPVFKEWSGPARFIIMDELIMPVFPQHLNACGWIVGLGRFRPENGGTNGRFRVTDIKWEEVSF